ncbi:hypothetical protein T484DRAFT_1617627, partial [Baffinella frigidus]
FFRGYDVLPDSVQLGTGPDGRSNGEGLVGFASSGEAARALQEKNRQHLGSRYIELFACNS